MTIQYPYRAVICGEEHIVEGWRGRKLITDKGSFHVRHIYQNWRIQDFRIFEVVLIRTAANGGWLLNGKEFASLEDCRSGGRLAAIPEDEDLRVHRGSICAFALLQIAPSKDVTRNLDAVLKSWNLPSPPVAKSVDAPELDPTLRQFIERMERTKQLLAPLEAISRTLSDGIFFKEWSKPIWLTEFRPVGQEIPLSPEQKKLASATAELQATKAQLHKAESAAGETLQEALSKWMRFDPPGKSATTKARIEKAVKLYVTDPAMRSLAKIASEFKVSRKTVSVWFKAFTKETGFPVVRHERHESIRAQSQNDSSKAGQEEAED